MAAAVSLASVPGAARLLGRSCSVAVGPSEVMGRRLGPTWGGLYRTSPGVLLVSQGHRTQVGYGDARKLARVPGHRAARRLIHASIGLLALPSDFCREVPDHRSRDGRGGERPVELDRPTGGC